MMTRLIALHLLFLGLATAHASVRVDSTEGPSPVTTTLPAGVFPNNWEIIYRDSSGIADVGLLDLRGDSLLLAGAARSVPLSTIESIRRRNGGHFWRGAAWGAGIMAPLAIAGYALVGVATAPRARAGEMVMVTGMWAGGALLGGIIGSFFPRTEQVELAILPVEERAATVREIIIDDAIERADALEELQERAMKRAEKAARAAKRRK